MSDGKVAKSGKRARRWGPRMVLILMAMVAVSFAFFTGLNLQAGLPMMPSLIASFALFLTLYGTLPKLRQPAPPSQPPAAPPPDLTNRLAMFENEIVTLSNRLEQLHGLSGKVRELDQLAPTVQKMEGFLDEMINSSMSLAGEQCNEANDSFAELADKLKHLDDRISDMNSQLAGENHKQQAQLQMQYIFDHQHADGYMLSEGVSNESDQPKRTTFDFTADFASWLIDNAAEFACMGE